MKRYSCLDLKDLESFPLSAYFTKATQSLKSYPILPRLPNNISEVRLLKYHIRLKNQSYLQTGGDVKTKPMEKQIWLPKSPSEYL
jgi:hypothetical protein